MPKIPDDIFTEPEDISPDTVANLGPLRRLAGVWQSDQGVDISPKAEGPEQREFREYIRMDPIDPQPNGPQLLYGLRYHIKVNTAEEATTFHDQVGYWLWEPATGLIMQSIAIPRGQVVLAGGIAKQSRTTTRFRWRRGAATPASGFAPPPFSKRRFAPTITASTSPLMTTTAGPTSRARIWRYVAKHPRLITATPIRCGGSHRQRQTRLWVC